MVGDTTFDMEMGRAAAVGTIGVSWGYHPVDRLRADHIVHHFADLPAAIDALLEPAG
jgi:phosphoglycolate phosphatase